MLSTRHVQCNVQDSVNRVKIRYEMYKEGAGYQINVTELLEQSGSYVIRKSAIYHSICQINLSCEYIV